LIVVAAFKAPAVVTGLDDVAVMSQTVEQRGRHLGIAGLPAAQAGIEGASEDGVIRDIITEVNGKPIHSMEEMTSILEDEGIGKKVELTIDRSGQTRIVKLTISDVSQLSQR
jgi:2-alkenal reductase